MSADWEELKKQLETQRKFANIWKSIYMENLSPYFSSYFNSTSLASDQKNMNVSESVVLKLDFLNCTALNIDYEQLYRVRERPLNIITSNESQLNASTANKNETELKQD